MSDDAAFAPGLIGMLSPLYAAAVAARGSLYDAGLLRAHRLAVPVVSVGNITVGGSGKSPMVALIAASLAGRGKNPVVVSRGYKGGYSGAAAVVSDGSGPLLSSSLAGDEPVMLSLMLPGVPIIVARRRRDGGQIAIERFKAGCVVLDDGFQHRALARDLDLLMVDAADPFGNMRLLPAGPLREPLPAMRRADALIQTRSGADVPEDAARVLRQAADRWCPGKPILHARSVSIGLMPAVGGDGAARAGGARRMIALETLRGARVVCFAGIGHPARFFDDVAGLGGVVVARMGYPDHHRYADSEIEGIAAAAREQSATMVLTTQKDLARLTEAQALSLRGLHALSQETRVDEQAQFEALLQRAVP